jgi:hypothetical protein
MRIDPTQLQAGDLLMAKYWATLGHTRIVAETSRSWANPPSLDIRAPYRIAVPEMRNAPLNAFTRPMLSLLGKRSISEVAGCE